jgi:hypothetical protein
MPTRRPTPRVSERPHPSQWGEDELMTLDEAVALYWPMGPLTVASLRTAIRNNRLPVAEVARKFLVSPKGIRAMSQPRTIGRNPVDSDEGKALSAKNRDHDSWAAALSGPK